ncbi:MAG TPA: TIGR02206 family membrane protein [Candidatus Eisenbacteria bacterium]|nr:TIGR02206 family membrane protein [Candidatus Eisenbacteria bacterium]
MTPFDRYGFEHVVTLALVVGAASLLTWAAKRSRNAEGRGHSAIRFTLATLLAGGLGFALVNALPLRGVEWLDILPLHLCDLAVVVAVWALVSRNQTACELLYFWGLTGTLIAMLTPDVDRGFPDSHCLAFFGLHGAVAISAVVMVFGVGVTPRPGANLRVFWITNAYALLAGVIDIATGENYLYLRSKPSQPTLLDVMGPWPWYILAADAVAFVLFWVLMAPFRLRHARGDPARRRLFG